MKAKEWLGTMKQAADYDPEITILIEKYGELLLKEQLSDVLIRLNKMRPIVELSDFDQNRKLDYNYCIEWGMKKQKVIEQGIYDRYIVELSSL